MSLSRVTASGSSTRSYPRSRSTRSTRGTSSSASVRTIFIAPKGRRWTHLRALVPQWGEAREARFGGRSLPSARGDRVEDDVERAVEIVLGDHEWRRQHQHVALPHLERKPGAEAAVQHALGERAVRRAARRVDELDAEQEARAAHVADRRQPPPRIAQAFKRMRAERVRALAEPLVVDDVERGESRRASDGALFVRVVAERAVGGDVEAF